MAVEVRPIMVDEFPAFRRNLQTAFFSTPDPAEDEENRERLERSFEFDRSRCAFEGDEMVGTLGAYSLSMTVPGGTQQSIAGTTMVAVMPTHRRQGILRQMMDAHFDEARGRGEFAAALFASDSAIYGRFGFGLATMWADATVDRNHVAPHPAVAEPATVELMSSDEFKEVAPDIYEAAVPARPGMFRRDEDSWFRLLDDRPGARDGESAVRCVVAGEGGSPTGYALYRAKPGKWERGHGDAELSVKELIAHTSGAAVGLWRFLFEHDLVSKIELVMRPEDDPVFSLLAGFRRGEPKLSDQLFIRLLDVPKALAARSYFRDGELILRVAEPDGEAITYRLAVDEGRAQCSEVVAEADVELGIEELSSAYLGRARLRQLAGVGRVRGHDEAVTRADSILTGTVAPWCQEIF